MRELFIYYRIPACDADAARAAVLSFQAALCAEAPGLVARVLRRPDEAGGTQTWMETYATDAKHHPRGVDIEMQARIESRARVLAPFLAGPRHVEVFVALAG